MSKTKKVKPAPVVNIQNEYNKPKTAIGMDLGCGQSKISVADMNAWLLPSGVQVDKVVGVDFVQVDGVDVVHDLTVFPYPFEDESIDAIHSSHFVEHLDGHERAKFFDECYRILKMGGKMRLIHPDGGSDRAAQDFTHKWPPIIYASYYYWNRAWREQNRLTHGYYALKCNFDFEGYHTLSDNHWLNKKPEVQLFAVTHYRNVTADMVVTLTKRV